jgi:hypothetical protein
MRAFGLMFGFTKVNGMPWLNYGILGDRDADGAWGRIGIVTKARGAGERARTKSRECPKVFPRPDLSG